MLNTKAANGKSRMHTTGCSCGLSKDKEFFSFRKCRYEHPSPYASGFRYLYDYLARYASSPLLIIIKTKKK